MSVVNNIIRNSNYSLRRYIGQSWSKNLPNRSFSTSSRLSGHGQIFYRSTVKPDRNYEIAAEVAGGFMWWWIFWHCMTDYGHIFGEFPFPDSSSWTNKELGIPDE